MNQILTAALTEAKKLLALLTKRKILAIKLHGREIIYREMLKETVLAWEQILKEQSITDELLNIIRESTNLFKKLHHKIATTGLPLASIHTAH